MPQEYFPEFEASHPGALASQWIPMDPQLWKIENFRDFLEARKTLLAAEMNRRMEELLHGDLHWLEARAAVPPAASAVLGGVTSDEQEEQLEALNDWVEAQGLPRGVVSFDFADPETGEQRAVFDLSWPQGLQEELSQPVAVLLNEEASTVAVASQAGYRCFTNTSDFKSYVQAEVMAVD